MLTIVPTARMLTMLTTMQGKARQSRRKANKTVMLRASHVTPGRPYHTGEAKMLIGRSFFFLLTRHEAVHSVAITSSAAARVCSAKLSHVPRLMIARILPESPVDVLALELWPVVLPTL